MPSVRNKLEAALESMIEEGAKINASAVEKRAGVSNGSVSYYEDIAEVVLEHKINQRGDKDKATADARKADKANISKADLDKKNADLRKAKSLKKKYFNENKALKDNEAIWAAKIGNLTMALHKERSEINSASEVIQLPKRGRQ
ncbi:hypothetical protein [Thaumasiovibrio sp. DFM-14]|uniref:hypothetical protein n=1 Tax=Thaumasiovibrio sp. DFM-14 TaxID=3384792 RepID=UPI0039A0D2BB